jgi:AraC-like DNA-binding protein
VRKMLGLMPQSSSGSGATERLRPVFFDQYNVFIQSTSYNRKLIGRTRMLYEVPDWDSSTVATSAAYKAPAYTVPKETAPETLKPSAVSRKVTKKPAAAKVIKSKGQLAYELKLKTDKPWTEIAKAVGYSDGSSASRAARKYEASM